MIKFDVSREEAEVISNIADRAIKLLAKMTKRWPSKMDVEMDITAVHRNVFPLRLTELLAADDGNFGHDVFGIMRYLDRSTGELSGCFVPRFAQRREE